MLCVLLLPVCSYRVYKSVKQEWTRSGDTSSSVSCGQLWILVKNDSNRIILCSFLKLLLIRSRVIFIYSVLKGSGSPQLHHCYHTITYTDTIKTWDEGNTWGHYILNSGMCPPEGDWNLSLTWGSGTKLPFCKFLLLNCLWQFLLSKASQRKKKTKEKERRKIQKRKKK